MPKTALRTDEALWQQIVKEVTAGDKGGKAGQWSARKAQIAVANYKEAGGGYIGPKSSDNSLAKWTREKWRTKSGKPSLETGERYLPSAAIEALTDKEYAATTKAKRAGMRKGKQFVPQPLEIATKVAPFRRARERQGNPMSATFYANPYGGATGFHFDSAEDFEQKFEKAGFEEYSIEFIDGDDTATLLAKCVPMGGAEIENWYALLDEVDSDEHLLQQIVAYTECNSSLDSVEDFESHRSYIEDGTIQEGDLQDLAHEFVDQGMIDLAESNYFDYESFARDLGYDGYNHEYLDPDDMKGSDEAKEELESDDYVFEPAFEGDADNADDVVRGLDEGTVCQGMTLEDYAEQLLEDTGISSDLAERYADFDKIARDLGYDYSEFDYKGRTYCCRFD
jgi:antirestriction protein